MRLPFSRRDSISAAADASDAPRADTSIAARLRWSYLISSTVPLLIVGAVLLNISWTAQRDSVYNDQQNLAVSIGRNVSGYLGKLSREIDTYASTIRPGATSPAQWQAAAQDLATANYPDLLGLALIDVEGQELLRVSNLQLIPDDQLHSVADDPSVQRALGSGQRVFDMDSPDGSAQGRSFTMTVPVPNDAGVIIGAIRAEVSSRTLSEELRLSTTGTNSIAYLVESDTGDVVLGDGSANFRGASSVARLLPDADGAAEYIGARGSAVIGAFAPIALNLSQQPEPVGWTVVVEEPSTIGFAAVRGQILALALLVVLVGSLALLWAFRQAQQFLKPLDELRVGAEQVGAGHLNYRIPLESADEMGVVARAFNHMAVHLQDSLAEIETQNERLRNGLALARDIQVGLLPDHAPWSEDAIEVYARSVPAYEVGGDFYSYMALSNGRAAVAIGDISGKGVGAALLMALTASAVESQARQLEHPAEVLTALNQLLAPRLKANHMNAALLFAVFDPHERTVRVANAGMISPVVISAKGNTFIDVGGLPVGSFAGAVYQEQVVRLEEDDAVLLLSDGVVEAHDPQGTLFGFERLEDTVASVNPRSSVRSLVEVVLTQVHRFMGEAEQHDDITMVAIRMGTAVRAERLDKEQSFDYATL